MPTFNSGISESVRTQLREALRPLGEAETAAQTLFYQGDLAAAERTCWRALAIAPRMSNGKPFTNVEEILGFIRLAQGRPTDALKFFGNLYPQSGGEGLRLGITIAYCRLGDYRSALAHYEEAMRFSARSEWLEDKDPNRPGSRSVAQIEASVLLARGQRLHSFLADHGESILRSAEKLRPNNPMISFELGKVLNENEKYTEAAIRFDKAASNGHGRLAENAKKRAEQVSGTIKWQKAEADRKRITDQQP
jgi:tetratricopeptide (TPR) repeat protein